MTFSSFTEIQNGRHGSTSFFVCAKNIVWSFFHNFNIRLIETRGCASDFLKMLQQFKMTTRSQLHFFLWAKTQKLKSEIFQILQSHPPRYADFLCR